MTESSSVGCINKYGRLCGVTVKQVVRSELIMPLQFTRFGIESENDRNRDYRRGGRDRQNRETDCQWASKEWR